MFTYSSCQSVMMICQVAIGSCGERAKPGTARSRISVSFTPPAGIVTQVITTTKVSYWMPTQILEERSVAIYSGDKLLVEIPDVTPQEKAKFPIEVGTFTTDECC